MVSALAEGEPGESVVHLHDDGGILRARIGYDLFHEIRTLLTKRQSSRLQTLGSPRWSYILLSCGA